MDRLGWLHTGLGLVALGSGLIVLLLAKGTREHRFWGYIYVASMVGLNLTAFLIHRVFKGFGPFHVLAVISLATLVAGFIPAYLKRPRADWLEWHYLYMSWSYVGLLAATAAEIAVRLPFVRKAGW